MIDRRLVSNFNWLFFLTCFGISILGVVTIYSANHGRPEAFFRNLYIKQIYWIGYGLVAMLIALALDYRLFSRYAYLIYILTLLGSILCDGQRSNCIGFPALDPYRFYKYSGFRVCQSCR